MFKNGTRKTSIDLKPPTPGIGLRAFTFWNWNEGSRKILVVVATQLWAGSMSSIRLFPNSPNAHCRIFMCVGWWVREWWLDWDIFDFFNYLDYKFFSFSFSIQLLKSLAKLDVIGCERSKNHAISLSGKH